MEKALASLIKFKAGTTREEAVSALRSIRHLIELPEGGEYVSNGDGTCSWKPGPVKVKDVLKEYNPEYGSPIFYIP